MLIKTLRTWFATTFGEECRHKWHLMPAPEVYPKVTHRACVLCPRREYLDVGGVFQPIPESGVVSKHDPD